MPSKGVARARLWTPLKSTIHLWGQGLEMPPTLVLTGNLLSFQLLLTIGSREGDHRRQLHQNVEDCEKSRRDMLDDSINFVIVTTDQTLCLLYIYLFVYLFFCIILITVKDFNGQ